MQQIQYVSTDGSAAPALEGISEASSVAASEDQTRPLLASYNGSVYRLPLDGNWSRSRRGQRRSTRAERRRGARRAPPDPGG